MRYPHPTLDQLAEPARSLAQAEYARLRDAGLPRDLALRSALGLAEELATTRKARLEHAGLEVPGSQTPTVPWQARPLRGTLDVTSEPTQAPLKRDTAP